MRTRFRYPTNFADVIECLRLQACESAQQFANDVDTADINSAADLWNNLKPRLIYVSDPPGVELFQTYQTLFYENFHGQPGAGDCDCFVITTLGAARACGLDCNIVLAGRDKTAPVHIWAEVDGVPFDLTNPELATTRNYPYLQRLNLLIEPI
jgi:hypothetical protein